MVVEGSPVRGMAQLQRLMIGMSVIELLGRDHDQNEETRNAELAAGEGVELPLGEPVVAPVVPGARRDAPGLDLDLDRGVADLSEAAGLSDVQVDPVAVRDRFGYRQSRCGCQYTGEMLTEVALVSVAIQRQGRPSLTVRGVTDDTVQPR